MKVTFPVPRRSMTERATVVFPELYAAYDTNNEHVIQ